MNFHFWVNYPFIDDGSNFAKQNTLFKDILAIQITQNLESFFFIC